MTIVLLTGDGPEHRYVANRLGDDVELASVIVETGRTLTASARARQLWTRYSVRQLGSRFARSTYLRFVGDGTQRSEQIDAVLGPRSREFERPEHIVRVESVNDLVAREIIVDLDPTRLLIYGTGIVGGKTLALSTRTPLNMHTGISPWYRGSSCAFWPIHNGEPEMCGATVHEVTSKVDGGAILDTVQAELTLGDGIHGVFARTVLAGTELYASVVKALDNQPVAGTPQDLSVGREYRAHMRGVRAEWRARRRLRSGLLSD